MRRLLSSPRRRRRALLSGGSALLVTAAVAVFFAFPNTAPKYKPPKSSGKEAPTPVDEPTPPTVKLTRAAQAAALQTASDFVRAAVLRKNVAASWQLTSPALRQGMSRKDWNTGNIPVAQYPASALQEVKWRVGHSYPNDLELEVLLLPKQGKEGQGLGPITYVIAMKTAGSGNQKHWVVNDLRPYGGLPEPSFAASGNTALDGASAKLSAYWLLIPAMLLALLVLLPFFLAFRSWRQGRRAERDYRASLERTG